MFKIQLFVLTKTLQNNLSRLHKAFSSSTILKERLSGDKSSLISESKSELEMLLEDLPMRQRTVKLHCLRLTFSFSSELEESSLEKLKSLKAAYARDMIFCNFFLSLKWYFFYCRPCRWSRFGCYCCTCTCWRSRASSSWGSR
jgi:hypothetical protein